MTKFYENQEPQAAGLTLADLKKLPETERSLVNWLRRSGKKSLTEIAEHIDQDEDSTLVLITPLVSQGFIKEVPGNPDAYQVKQPQRRKQSTLSKLARKKKDQDQQESETDDQEEID